MGSCISKKLDPPLNHPQSKTLTTLISDDKKPVFVIKHRNSHESQTPKSRFSRSSSRRSDKKEPNLDLDNQTLVTNYTTIKGKEVDDNGDGDGNEVSLADRISRHRRSRSFGNSGRRVSRSPSRRSVSPVSGTTSASSNIGANNNNNRPGKMVSVPATVGGEHMVNRISVRRNVGDPSMTCLSGLSPRGRSPAKRATSLSRSNSRREEYSPYRRNALDDIDQNCPGNEVQASYPKTNGENSKSNRFITQGAHSGPMRSIATEEHITKNKAEKSQPMKTNFSAKAEGSKADNLKQQTVPKRSPRLSRDLDLNQDVLNNPTPSSYTALLLEDIQSFHQKNASTVSLPPCVSKAQSIVDAVADLNSGTKSNFYAPLCDHRRKNPTPVPCHVSDDLADPTFHNYVTVKRGTMDVDEEEEEESSGSNSFVSGTQHWVSSSSWEPNSSDSTGYCTSSRSNNREDKNISMGSKGHTRNFSGSEEKKREPDQQRSGIGRYRVGYGRS